MSASPAPQTPTTSMSTNSPIPLTAGPAHRPSLAMKPSQEPSSPAVSSPAGIVTHKEWVVPPRPKPGRKPATDTPPTKRKAQNRAAQRAFRERRAARVGELEEQMKQMEEEVEPKRRVLKADIERLQREVEEYSTNLGLWIEKCRRLERELAVEREGKNGLNERDAQSTEAVPLPRRTSSRSDIQHSQPSAQEE